MGVKELKVGTKYRPVRQTEATRSIGTNHFLVYQGRVKGRPVQGMPTPMLWGFNVYEIVPPNDKVRYYPSEHWGAVKLANRKLTDAQVQYLLDVGLVEVKKEDFLWWI